MTLPPFKLERYFARHEFKVEYVLCASDCESLSIGDLLAREPGAAEALSSRWLGYTETPGRHSLRQEIARIYDTVSADDVLVHSGAEEAIFTCMHALLSPGDHVVVHSPCYQSLAEIPRSLGCEVSVWQGRADDAWALDLEEFRRLLLPRTRLVVVNSPHNPTGYLMPRDMFQKLAQITSARGIILFSDEVYRELEHDAEARLPAAVDLTETTVSLGVMSKTYGLPGLRIGWVATHNRSLLERMAAIKDYTTICNSAPSEFLAELALRHRQALAERNLEIIRHNLGRLDDFFGRHFDRFVWRRPTAGPIAFPRFLGGDVTAFCDDLVDKSGVLLLPGTVYGDRRNHFRIGFGRRNMPEAVARLDEYLARYG